MFPRGSVGPANDWTEIFIISDRIYREWFPIKIIAPDQNADTAIFLTDLVQAHAQRFWIERSFQDAKTFLGMADYQARKWNSWNHHMTLVSLAMYFGLTERLHHNTVDDLLSYQDIVELLNIFLPRTDRTEEQVLHNLNRRHEKRIRSTLSAYKTQVRKKPPKKRLTK